MGTVNQDLQSDQQDDQPVAAAEASAAKAHALSQQILNDKLKASGISPDQLQAMEDIAQRDQGKGAAELLVDKVTHSDEFSKIKKSNQ